MGNDDVRKFFEGAAAPAAVPAPVAPPPPEPKEAVDADKLAEEAVQAAPLDPHDAYLKELERLKVSKEEAAKIVDAMLFKGFYEEDVPLTKKVKIKLRTRGQDAVDRLNQAIDRIDPKYNGTLYSLIAEYNLSASLVAYGPHAFDPSTEEGFERTRKYVKSLPTPVFQLLATKLSKFDEKTMVVMTEGAVESFF